MEALYELRMSFGEDAEDITAAKTGDDEIAITQGSETIIIPEKDAKSLLLRSWRRGSTTEGSWHDPQRRSLCEGACCRHCGL